MRCESSAALLSAAERVPMNGRLIRPLSSIWTALVLGSGTPCNAIVKLSPGRSCAVEVGTGIDGLAPARLDDAQPATANNDPSRSPTNRAHRKSIGCFRARTGRKRQRLGERKTKGGF